MAKKDFKAVMGNPAERFFTAPAQVEEKPSKKNTQLMQDAKLTDKTEVAYKDQREKKTQRVQLVVAPSVFEDIKTIALMKRQSVNAYIHSLLEHDCQANADIIKQYKEITWKGE